MHDLGWTLRAHVGFLRVLAASTWQESTSFLKKRSKKLLSVWALAFPDGFSPDE
jgi:hypothetical protein